jgi:hypothetical protein
MKTPDSHTEPGGFSIDLTRSFDRVYWGLKLRVSLEQLADAVQAVGPNVIHVREYVESRRAEWQGATL